MSNETSERLWLPRLFPQTGHHALALRDSSCLSFSHSAGLRPHPNESSDSTLAKPVPQCFCLNCVWSKTHLSCFSLLVVFFLTCWFEMKMNLDFFLIESGSNQSDNEADFVNLAGWWTRFTCWMNLKLQQKEVWKGILAFSLFFIVAKYTSHKIYHLNFLQVFNSVKHIDTVVQPISRIVMGLMPEGRKAFSSMLLTIFQYSKQVSFNAWLLRFVMEGKSWFFAHC